VSCVICVALGDKRAESLLPHESDFVAFPHPKPETPVHIVVATRQHFSGLCDPDLKDPAVVGQMVALARGLAEQTGLVATGFRLVLNHGAHAEQEVPHLHLHLLGGRMLQWPPG